MTIESFAQVLDDDRVSQVVIVDDCSTDGSVEQLRNYFSGNNKIIIYENVENMDCYRNKQIAISYASNDWCILLDSDNIIDVNYINVLYSIPLWNNDTVYQPVFAKPHFDFRHISGAVISRSNLKDFIYGEKLQVAFNAMNFFINKQTYLNAFDPCIDPHTSDSIYMAYRLLVQDNKYFFVPGLEYEHRVGHPSHYTINNHKTGNFHQEVLQRLYSL